MDACCVGKACMVPESSHDIEEPMERALGGKVHEPGKDDYEDMDMKKGSASAMIDHGDGARGEGFVFSGKAPSYDLGKA